MEHARREITFPIVETVSDVLGRPVDDLPPLSDSVDIEALDAIASLDQSHDVTVTFRYAGLQVLVRSGETVYVSPDRYSRSVPRNPGHVYGR